jgi:N-acetylmuramic acid 6-phosphate etherase
MTESQKENLGQLNTETIDPRYSQIDFLTTSELLKLINENDHGVSLSVGKVLPQIEQAILEITKRMSQGGRLIYVGAGTSGRLGVLDASECIPTFSIPEGVVIGLIAGGDAALRKGIEGAEDNRDGALSDLQELKLSKLDTVVGIAASGRTPYAIGAMEFARSIGALSVALTCNPNSEMSKYADVAIEVDSGSEILAGSTRMKAGTAQKLVLNMISTVTMINLGKTFGNLMVDLQVTNVKLRDRAIRIIQAATQVDAKRAEEALQAANNQVKVAIVMLLLQVTPTEAISALASANSRVREAIKTQQ